MNRRKRGAYDEGDYKERNKEPVPEIEPAEMKDFDPSKRSKFDDQVSQVIICLTSISTSIFWGFGFFLG